MKFLNESIKPLLAFFITFCAFGYFFTCFFSERKPDPQVIIAIVAMMQIPANYYFGNSQGSAKKDEIIQQQSQNNTDSNK